MNMTTAEIIATLEDEFFKTKLPRLLKQRAELSLYFANLLVDKEFEDLDLQVKDLAKLANTVLGEFVDIGDKIRNEKIDNK